MRIYLINVYTFIISCMYTFYINNKFNKKLEYVCVRALFNPKAKKINERKEIRRKFSEK